VGDLLVGSGFDRDGIDLARIGVEILLGVGLPDRLEDGLVDFPGLGIGAAGGGEAVNDAVDLPQIRPDRFDDLLLDRKSVV